LGTDLLPKLECYVVLPQNSGKMVDLLQNTVWDKSQCSSPNSCLRAEAPSFVPVAVQGMAAEVSHDRMRYGTSQLSAEVKPIEEKGKSLHTGVKVPVDTEMVHYPTRGKIQMVAKPISQQSIEVKLI